MQDSTDDDELAAAALHYARNGHAVLPLFPGTKVPRVKRGLHAATTDIETVRQHWDTHSRDNIGLRPAEGVLVLDVESVAGHGVDGHATLAALIAELGPLPENCPIAETATGGRHIWLRCDGGPLVASLGSGIDVKKHSGYLVVPPSRINGIPYRWIVPL